MKQRNDNGRKGERRGAETDRDLFEEAMRDVEPLAPRAAAAPARRPRSPARPAAEGRPPRFSVERDGARHRGLAEGRPPRLLARLRGGAFAVDAEIDLHGLDAGQARRHLESEAERAWRRGCRCLLVIHGRGRGSLAGPVLRPALPDWLTAPPLARRVVAFTTAPDALGGSGATLVLLRPAPRRGRL